MKKISATVRGTRTSTAPELKPVMTRAAIIDAYDVATEDHTRLAVRIVREAR